MQYVISTMPCNPPSDLTYLTRLKPGQVQVPPLKEEYFMECRRYLPFIFPTLENQLFTMLNSRNEEVTILRTPYELLSRYGKVRIQGSVRGPSTVDYGRLSSTRLIIVARLSQN